MTAQTGVPDIILAAVIAGFMLLNIFIFLIVYALRHSKAGPNEVLIVSGRSHRVTDAAGRERVAGFRIVKGGGTFVWPVFEQAQRLSLEMMTLRVSIPGLEASACVRIKGDPHSILAAAERFLSRKPEEIATIARDLLEQHARKALGGGDPRRETIEGKVKEGASAELAPMGLEVMSFAAKETSDGVGKG